MGKCHLIDFVIYRGCLASTVEVAGYPSMSDDNILISIDAHQAVDLILATYLR